MQWIGKTVGRVAAGVMAAVLALSMTACGGDEVEAATDEQKSAVVLTVDGVEFTAEQYAASFLYNLNRLDSMMSMYGQQTSADITDEDTRQTYNDNVAALAQQQLVYLAVCEEQMEAAGLTVEDSEIDEQMSQFEEQMGGADAVDEYLKGVGITRDQYRDFMRLNVMVSKLRADYLEKNPDAAREKFEADYLRCKHVLIKTVDDNNNELEDQDALKAKAEEVAQRAKAGEDFDTLIAEYNEDPGMESSPDGYVFTEGEMVDEFYQGTKALEIGGISDPIKSSYGWHIIERLPLRDEDFESVQATIEQNLFSDQATAWQDAATVEEKDGFPATTLDPPQSYARSPPVIGWRATKGKHQKPRPPFGGAGLLYRGHASGSMQEKSPVRSMAAKAAESAGSFALQIPLRPTSSVRWQSEPAVRMKAGPWDAASASARSLWPWWRWRGLAL